jgi:hypothetical protein
VRIPDEEDEVMVAVDENMVMEEGEEEEEPEEEPEAYWTDFFPPDLRAFRLRGDWGLPHIHDMIQLAIRVHVRLPMLERVQLRARGVSKGVDYRTILEQFRLRGVEPIDDKKKRLWKLLD